MPRTRTKAPASAALRGSGDWPARLTRWGFVLAIVLVCARATISEILREPFEPQPGAQAAPRGAGPAASLLLDLLCCLPALAVLSRRVIDRTYVVRWSWSHIPMLLLAVWMAASVGWAGDKFAAMVGAANFIAALAVLWSATQLVRSWGRLRLVTAAMFGVLLVYIACGLEYRFLDLPELRRDFLSRRAEILRERGLEEGTFAAGQFEKKVMGGDIGCFSTSPNTYAATIVLLCITAGGLLAQRFSNRDRIGWAVPIPVAFALSAVVLYFTHSRTAAAAAVLGAGLLVIIALARTWLAEHAKLAYWAVIVIMGIGAVAVVGHGLVRGNLIEKSLTFRWYYWTGAARLVEAHPVRGVGWNNFGPRYLAVRSAQATEEVQDPHNFIVKSFAELGIVGGVLMIAWMGRLWWELTRPVFPATPPMSGDNRRRTMLLLGALSGSAMLLSLLMSLDFAQGAAWVFLQAFRYAVGALLLWAGLASAGLWSLAEESIDQRPGPCLLYGILVALGMFLLHNLIDFALSETSALFIFALLAGSAAGVRYPSLAGQKRHRGIAAGALAGAAVLWVLAAVIVFGRTASAESSASEADEAMRQKRPDVALRGYLQARESQPLNAEYPFRAAQAAMYMGLAHLSIPQGFMEHAIHTNPYLPKYYVGKAGAELATEKPDKAVVAHAFQGALELDPRNVRMRLSYAAAMEKLADGAAAAEQYRQALRVDDELPADEPKKLSPQMRAEIQKKIEQLGK